MRDLKRGAIKTVLGLMAGIVMLGFIGCGKEDDSEHTDANPAGSMRPIVQLTVEDAEARESGDVATMQVILNSPATTDIAITYFVEPDSTATPGIDFVELSGSVTIPPGMSSAQIIVTPIDDIEVDCMEIVRITLNRGSEYNLGIDRSAQVAIAGDDAPQLTVTTDTPEISESGEAGSFTIMLAEATANELEISYQVVEDASVIPGVDYEAFSGNVMISAGERSVSIPVYPIDNELFESDKMVTIELLPFGSTYEVDFPKIATILITDDELPTVDIVAALDTATENGTEGIFLLTTPAPAKEDLVIKYESYGTAENGYDYDSILQTAIIPAGETFAEIFIMPVRDNNDTEGEEFVTLHLLPGDGYDAGDSIEATITINDYVVPMEIEPITTVTWEAIDDIATRDGDTGTIRLTADRIPSEDLNIYIVPYAPESGWAMPGIDYVAPPSQITIPKGQTSTTIDIIPIEDSPTEGDTAVFFLFYGGPGCETNNFDGGFSKIYAGMVTIIDQEPLPIVRLTSNDATASENGDTASFTVTIDRPLPTPTKVYYEIAAPFSGLWEEDAELLPGSITIPAGGTSATQKVIPLRDSISEGREILALHLTQTEEYRVIAAEAYLEFEILPDNTFPSATVKATDRIASELGLDPASFRVQLERPAREDIRIDIAAALSGTAIRGLDYVSYPSETLVIPKGANSGDITIVPIDDTEPEFTENIYFILEYLPGYIITEDTAGISLYSDEIKREEDPPEPPQLTAMVINEFISESSEEPGIIRLSLNDPVAEDVIIHCSLYGRAEEGVDFQNLEESYVIPAGEQHVDVQVIPIDDDLLEETEHVYFDFQSDQFEIVNLGAGPEIRIISDEKGPRATIIATAPIAHEGGAAAVCEVRLDREAPSDVLIYIKAYDNRAFGSNNYETDYNIEGITEISNGYFTRDVVKIPAGYRSAEIKIIAIDDNKIESVEKVELRLEEGAAYILESSSADVYLVSEDPGPLAGIFAINRTAIEGGEDATFEIILSQPTTAGLDISYRIDEWGSMSDNDMSHVVTVPKGASSILVKVKAADYPSFVGDSLEISLQPGPGYGTTRQNMTTVYFQDAE